MTKSNVSLVCHWVISALIRLMFALFRAAFCAQTSNISVDVSMPVMRALGLFANRHSDAPPVPMPTSSTLFALRGANAANHTASDVGL